MTIDPRFTGRARLIKWPRLAAALSSVLLLTVFSSCSPAIPVSGGSGAGPVLEPPANGPGPLSSLRPEALLVFPGAPWTLSAAQLSGALLTPAAAGSVVVTASGVQLTLNPLYQATVLKLTLQRTGEASVTLTLYYPGVLAGAGDELLKELNAVRATGYRCPDGTYPAAPALIRNALLERAALAHALDMFSRDYFSHFSPEGASPMARAVGAGYTAPTLVIGEDLAKGPTSAAGALSAWLQSPEHCKSVLSAVYRDLGLGIVAAPPGAPLWVALLGQR